MSNTSEFTALDRHAWNAILGKDLSAEEFLAYHSIVNTYKLPTDVVINLGLPIFADHTTESFRQAHPELYI